MGNARSLNQPVQGLCRHDFEAATLSVLDQLLDAGVAAATIPRSPSRYRCPPRANLADQRAYGTVGADPRLRRRAGSHRSHARTGRPSAWELRSFIPPRGSPPGALDVIVVPRRLPGQQPDQLQQPGVGRPGGRGRPWSPGSVLESRCSSLTDLSSGSRHRLDRPGKGLRFGRRSGAKRNNADGRLELSARKAGSGVESRRMEAEPLPRHPDFGSRPRFGEDRRLRSGHLWWGSRYSRFG